MCSSKFRNSNFEIATGMRSHFFQTTISNGGAARLLPFFIIEMKKARIIIKKLREKTAQEQTIQEQGRQLGNMDFTGTGVPWMLK